MENYFRFAAAMVENGWVRLGKPQQWRSVQKTRPPHRELLYSIISGMLPPTSKMVETGQTCPRVRIHWETTSTTTYGYATRHKPLKSESASFNNVWQWLALIGYACHVSNSINCQTSLHPLMSSNSVRWLLRWMFSIGSEAIWEVGVVEDVVTGTWVYNRLNTCASTSYEEFVQYYFHWHISLKIALSRNNGQQPRCCYSSTCMVMIYK